VGAGIVGGKESTPSQGRVVWTAAISYGSFTYPPWRAWNRIETPIDEAAHLQAIGLEWCATTALGC